MTRAAVRFRIKTVALATALPRLSQSPRDRESPRFYLFLFMPRPKGLPKTGGKQKGSKHKTTLEREYVQERARESYIARMARRVEAYADRQNQLIDGPDARVALSALVDALDRLIGKSAQTMELTGKNGGPIETKRVEFVDA